MFELFPDMRRILIEKIISFYLSKYHYGGKETIDGFWKNYVRYDDTTQVKITQIRVFQKSLFAMCLDKDGKIWLLSMLLERGCVFGELELGARDACVRYLLSQTEACSHVWSRLLTTDFIPVIYVDDYIANIKNSSNKYLIPLLISVKFGGARVYK